MKQPKICRQLSQSYSLTKSEYEWLYFKGSLTARLENLIGGRLGVQVVSEGTRLLLMDEKKQLGLPLSKPMMAWCRIVYLYDKSQEVNQKTALVRAISLFPFVSLVGEGRRLKHLQSTPIGYVLFKKNRTLPYERTIIRSMPKMSIQRRTVYDWHGRKLMIEEVFLPSLLSMINTTQDSLADLS